MKEEKKYFYDEVKFNGNSTNTYLPYVDILNVYCVLIEMKLYSVKHVLSIVVRHAKIIIKKGKKINMKRKYGAKWWIFGW